MSNRLTFSILAVTKTFDSYCIAGMDQNGDWYRPLPNGRGKFWSTVCYGDGTFIEVGDVWVINDYIKEPDQISIGHTEDIRLKSPPTYVKKLSDRELIQFVQAKQENSVDLEETINADKRSLCLIKVDSFTSFINTYNEKKSSRILFEFEGISYRNTTRTPGFPVTDLKWRAYILQECVPLNDWQEKFICIGLARKEPNKDINQEYPMVISIITEPNLLIIALLSKLVIR